MATMWTAPWMIAILNADDSLWFSTLHHTRLSLRLASRLANGFSVVGMSAVDSVKTVNLCHTDCGKPVRVEFRVLLGV